MKYNSMLKGFVKVASTAAICLSLYSSPVFAKSNKLYSIEWFKQISSEIVKREDNVVKIAETGEFRAITNVEDYTRELFANMEKTKQNMIEFNNILDSSLKKGQLSPDNAKKALVSLAEGVGDYANFKGLYFKSLVKTSGVGDNQINHRFYRKVDFHAPDLISRLIDSETNEYVPYPEKEIHEFGDFARKYALYFNRNSPMTRVHRGSFGESLENVIDFLSIVSNRNEPVKYSFNRYLPELDAPGEVVDEYLHSDDGLQSLIEAATVFCPIVFGIFALGYYFLFRNEEKEKQNQAKDKNEPDELNTQQLVDVWNLQSNKTETKQEEFDIWNIGKSQT